VQVRFGHAIAGERQGAVRQAAQGRASRGVARLLASARWLVLALCLGCALPAFADVREIAPGAEPALQPGEGLLLVEADADADLNWLQLVRLGEDGDDFDALRDAKAGVTTRLIAVPAGRYAWRAVGPRGGKRYTFGNEEAEAFVVAAGKITYPGDMVLRTQGRSSGITFETANRGLRALDWLEARNPQLVRTAPFVYSGHYPDPFPAFYASERAASPATATDLSTVAAPPSATHLPLSPLDLWHYRRIDSASLNPAGDLVAEAVHENDTVWALELVDLRTHERTRLAEGPSRFATLDWSGDRVLLAGAGDEGSRAKVTLFDIRTAEQGAPTFTSERLPNDGRVLATDYGVADQILFERRGAFGRLEVVALDIARRAGVRSFDAVLRGRLDNSADPDIGWFADGHGNVRAAMLHKDDGTRALMYGDGTRFDAVLPLRDDGGFHPLGLSDEGDLVFGLSDEGSGQRDLVAFDPKQGKVVRTLFAKPGVDVLDAVLDAHGQPIGATYFENGQRVNAFFAADAPALQDALARAFPDRSVQVAGRSHDGAKLLLWVEASDLPATLYRYDVASAQAERVDVAAPWLEGHTFVPSVALQATSRDGLPVEAYLTLPSGEGRHPLVVLPHGGPIGVSDRRLFNPEVQFLASLGYGVLQVNFRGSDGYGTAFREAGYHAAGTAIEDDIDAALQVALSRYPLDASRMCIMGSSYGGYSALQSAIRWPDRFRCAVSIAGITDRMLFFSASDSGTTAATRAELERLVGNPATEYAEMLATSPLYRYRALTLPVMLVHGRDDARVDYEHARRLVRMLNIAGNKPVMLSFDREGHTWRDLNDIATAYRGVAGFLQQHLGSTPPPGPVASQVPLGIGAHAAR
jgi:dipeptidyl aminopeptidase/acylaminoacyl peptidase